MEVGDPIYLYFLGKQSKNVLSDSIPSGGGMEMKKEYKLAAGSKNSKGADFLPNMPTEEVFTAGDRDRVDGYVSNKKRLSYQGNIIDNFELTFEDRKVVDFKAEQGYEISKQLLDTDEGLRRIGEVALVPNDSPISNSGLLYYQTLFDENASNHLALGAAYPTNVKNDTKMTEKEL